MRTIFIVTALALISGAAVHAQSTQQTAKDIAMQPANDVNLKKVKIPEKLQDIEKRPYSLKKLNSCKALAAEITELDEALGPDLDEKVDKSASEKRNSTAKRVGGFAAGALIPFRGIVREVSGAAKAQRKYNTAVTAGVTRRGFIKGIGQQRGCGPSARPVSVK